MILATEFKVREATIAWFNGKLSLCLNSTSYFLLIKNALNICLSYDGQMDLSVQDVSAKNIVSIVLVSCIAVKIVSTMYL
jgi:hypothetical protein